MPIIKIPKSEHKKIASLVSSGEVRQVDLAEDYDVSRESIRQICIKELGKKFFDDRHKEAKKKAEKKNKEFMAREKIREDVRNGKRFCIKYERCTKCNRSDRKHKGNGLCDRCYSLDKYHKSESYRTCKLKSIRKWQKNNPEAVKKITDRATRKYFNKIYADPVLHAEHKRKSNERYRLRKNKKNETI